MLTLKQARDNLDTVVKSVRMTREEHELLRMSLEMLYDAARERQEDEADGRANQ